LTSAHRTQAVFPFFSSRAAIDTRRLPRSKERRTVPHREEPPGGVLERDESIVEGLLREVREETGLVVEPLALIGVYKNMRLGVVALVFRCRLVDGTLTENSEAAGFRWVQESEVSAIMPEAFAIRILDAYRNDAEPSI
jgi:8-oxo-dGTP diphosphatase